MAASVQSCGERALRGGATLGPWRNLEDVEFATLEWVWWFNQHRLLEPIGYVPRPSTSRRSTTARRLKRPRRHSRNEVSGKPGAVHVQLQGCTPTSVGFSSGVDTG